MGCPPDDSLSQISNHPYTKNTRTKQNETERKHKDDLRDGENHGILIFTNGFCTLMETSKDQKNKPNSNKT